MISPRDNIVAVEIRLSNLEARFNEQDGQRTSQHNENSHRLLDIEKAIERLTTERSVIQRIMGVVWLVVSGVVGALATWIFEHLPSR